MPWGVAAGPPETDYRRKGPPCDHAFSISLNGGCEQGQYSCLSMLPPEGKPDEYRKTNQQHGFEMIGWQHKKTSTAENGG